MDDDELIPLSALQHYLYCPRQCALIHLERLWAENRHTAEGRLLHQRTDTLGAEQRRGVRTVTAMPLAAPELGIVGVADVVEFHAGDAGAMVRPVEYKRGRPKAHRADEVQLCAQALCLESMLGCDVPDGDLFYGKTRRRTTVTFDDELRQLTRETIDATRALIEGGRTPSVKYQARRCDACSLIELCQPRQTGRQRPVQAWIRRRIESEE